MKQGHARALKVYDDGLWLAHKGFMVRLRDEKVASVLNTSCVNMLCAGDDFPIASEYVIDSLVGMDNDSAGSAAVVAPVQ